MIREAKKSHRTKRTNMSTEIQNVHGMSPIVARVFVLQMLQKSKNNRDKEARPQQGKSIKEQEKNKSLRDNGRPPWARNLCEHFVLFVFVWFSSMVLLGLSDHALVRVVFVFLVGFVLSVVFNFSCVSAKRENLATPDRKPNLTPPQPSR